MTRLAFAGALRRVIRVQKPPRRPQSHPKIEKNFYSQGSSNEEPSKASSTKAVAFRWQNLAEQVDAFNESDIVGSALNADEIQILDKLSAEDRFDEGNMREMVETDHDPYLYGLDKVRKRTAMRWNNAVAGATEKNGRPLPARVGDLLQSTDSALRITWRLLALASEMLMQIDSSRPAHAILPSSSTLTTETVREFVKTRERSWARDQVDVRWLSAQPPLKPYVSRTNESLAVVLAKRCDQLYKFCRVNQMDAPMSLVNYQKVHSRGLQENLLAAVFALPKFWRREDKMSFKVKRENMRLSSAKDEGPGSEPRGLGLRSEVYGSWMKEARDKFLMNILRDGGVHDASSFVKQCAFKVQPSKESAQLNEISVKNRLAVRHRISKLPWNIRPKKRKAADSFVVQTIVVEESRGTLIDVIDTLVVPPQTVPNAAWQVIYWTYLAGIIHRESAIKDLIRREFLLSTVKDALEHDLSVLRFAAARALYEQRIEQAAERSEIN